MKTTFRIEIKAANAGRWEYWNMTIEGPVPVPDSVRVGTTIIPVTHSELDPETKEQLIYLESQADASNLGLVLSAHGWSDQ